MPKLKTVIASILSSLDDAQHQSNLTTSQLAKQYSTDEALKYLQLPNAVMSEIDITLRFAIKEYVEESARILKKNSQAIKLQPVTLNRSANLATAEKLVEKIRSNLSGSAALTLDDEVKRKALVSRVQDALYSSGLEKKSADDTSTAVSKVVSEAILEGKEIPTKQKEALSDIIYNNRQLVGTLSAEEVGDLDVIVDGTSLAGMPAEAIQTLHITTKMENYRWIQSNDSSAPGEFVIVD